MNNTNTTSSTKTNIRKNILDIDRVFKEKNASLYKWIPNFIITYLKKITHQDELNALLNDNPDSYGIDFGEVCIKYFNVVSKTVDLDKIDKSGRYLFVANHPLGALDGIIFTNEIGKVFDEVKFPVNDILMHIGRFNDIFVPINKHGAQAREATKNIEKAFASQAQMLFFPAGLVSRKINGKVTDLDWKSTFVKKAIKHNRHIVPVHIDANNSNFFYNFSLLRRKLGLKLNLEMLYLADEVFKQKGKTITLTFGEPIPCQELQNGDGAKKWAKKIRKMTYRLPKLN